MHKKNLEQRVVLLEQQVNALLRIKEKTDTDAIEKKCLFCMEDLMDCNAEYRELQIKSEIQAGEFLESEDGLVFACKNPECSQYNALKFIGTKKRP